MKTYKKSADGKLQETNTVTVIVEYSLPELQRERIAAEATRDAAIARMAALDALIAEHRQQGATI